MTVIVDENNAAQGPHHRRISPMGFGSPGVFVKRAYREGKPFQWIREAKVNADEAGATKVLFDVDMASYEKLGVIRMQIEDNGCGIEPDNIHKFLNTFGGTGKSIGDEHDNFGIGIKSSALPWNGDGIVVRSLINDQINISVIVFDQVTDEIGLEHLPTDDQDNVDENTTYATTLVFDVDEYKNSETWIWRDIDWLGSFPQWIVDEGHGTVLTFLGTAAHPDTFHGDPDVDEERSSHWAYVWYSDRRFWKIPQGHEFRIGGSITERESLDQKLKRKVPKGTRHWDRRRVRGLHDCIYMVPKKAGQPPDADESEYEDETNVTTQGWVKTASFDIGDDNLPATCTVYFKDIPGIDPSRDIGWDPARYGVVTALYKNECYDIDRGYRHRLFGIPFAAIYNKVWIVIEPNLSGPDESGVYPGTSRSILHWKGRGVRAGSLPWSEWAEEFVLRMDSEVPFLAAAIKGYISGNNSGDDVSKSLLKRTAGKFLSRFKPLPKPSRYSKTARDTKTKGKLRKVEDQKTDEEGENPGSSGGRRGKGRKRPNPSPGPNSGQFPGTNDGNKSGDKSLVPHAKGNLHLLKRDNDDDDLPEYKWVDFTTVYPDRLAEAGQADLAVIYIEQLHEVHCHINHSVVEEVIHYWVNDYGETYREAVIESVKDVYGTAMSMAVGHIVRQQLDPDTYKHRISELTSKFYGLYDLNDLVAARIHHRIGRRGTRIRKQAAGAAGS